MTKYDLNEIVRLISPVESPREVTLAEAVLIIKSEPLPLKRRSYMIVRERHPALTYAEIEAIYAREGFPRA